MFSAVAWFTSTAVGAVMLLTVGTSQNDWRPLASCLEGLRGAAMSLLLRGGRLAGLGGALGGALARPGVGRLGGVCGGGDAHWHAALVAVRLRHVDRNAAVCVLLCHRSS